MPSYLSYSQLSLYLECPLQYKLRYIDGLTGDRTPAALIFGRSIHQVLAYFYTGVMEGRPFSLAAFLNEFVTTWTEAVEEQEIVYGKNENFNSLLVLGQEMLKVFAREVLPQRVIAIEVPFEFRLEHPETREETSMPLRGIIDLIEEDEQGTLWVVDHKTSSRSYADQQIAGDLQMLIYAAAVKQVDEAEGREVMLRLDVLMKTKAPKFIQYPLQRVDDDIVRLFEIVEGIYTAIEAEAFYPRCCIYCRWGSPHEECVKHEEI